MIKATLSFFFASSWHFTLFHDEDARSNNPQVSVLNIKGCNQDNSFVYEKEIMWYNIVFLR